MLLGQRDRA